MVHFAMVQIVASESVMVMQAGTVSKKMEIRKHMLLQHIYRNGSIGRLELGRDLQMSKSRLCEVVQDMIDEGLVVETLDGKERRGRRPVPLSVNPDYGCFVGLDFEAKRMRVVVTDSSGRSLFKKHQASVFSLFFEFLMILLKIGAGEASKASRKSLMGDLYDTYCSVAHPQPLETWRDLHRCGAQAQS